MHTITQRRLNPAYLAIAGVLMLFAGFVLDLRSDHVSSSQNSATIAGGADRSPDSIQRVNFESHGHAASTASHPIGHVPIEELRPLHRVAVEAPHEAVEADPYSSGVLDLTEPGPLTHKLLQIRTEWVWEDGTVDDINVRTVQSNAWCDAVRARVGSEVPLPLDLVDMGLPEGLTGTVLSIQQCPQPPPGPGRLVLTTVNHLNRDVIELDLRGSDGKVETLRPTGNHKLYSVTRNEWLSAGDLREGEQLDGVGGLVTVAAKRTLPGTHRVYNLTVQGEHLYRVAHSGVLVHNTCPTERAIAAAQRHGGTIIEDGRIIFPTRRAARQAASEIAGNLGPGTVPIRLRDFKGAPWPLNNSNRVIGRRSLDGKIGWRDDFLGHPQFGMGPHVNVWVDGFDFHLFYPR